MTKTFNNSSLSIIFIERPSRSRFYLWIILRLNWVCHTQFVATSAIHIHDKTHLRFFLCQLYYKEKKTIKIRPRDSDLFDYLTFIRTFPFAIPWVVNAALHLHNMFIVQAYSLCEMVNTIGHRQQKRTFEHTQSPNIPQIFMFAGLQSAPLFHQIEITLLFLHETWFHSLLIICEDIYSSTRSNGREDPKTLNTI